MAQEVLDLIDHMLHYVRNLDGALLLKSRVCPALPVYIHLNGVTVAKQWAHFKAECV